MKLLIVLGLFMLLVHWERLALDDLLLLYLVMAGSYSPESRWTTTKLHETIILREDLCCTWCLLSAEVGDHYKLSFVVTRSLIKVWQLACCFSIRLILILQFREKCYVFCVDMQAVVYNLFLTDTTMHVLICTLVYHIVILLEGNCVKIFSSLNGLKWVQDKYISLHEVLHMRFSFWDRNSWFHGC